MTSSSAIFKSSRFKRWLANLLILCMIATSLLTLTLIPLSNSSSRLNARQIFESSRWHSLQLQLQTYRLMNYISDLSAEDLPINGLAFFQYDLVLSRIDILRKGDLGSHIRSFANGRAIRLLNIIAGELELISLNIKHLEQGQLDQAPIIMDRLRSLDTQIADFVVIVNQGANEFVTNKREEMDVKLTYIQFIALALLIISSALLIITYKLSRDLRHTLSRNKSFEERINNLQTGKVEIISRIVNEMQPTLNNLISSSSSIQGKHPEPPVTAYLEQVSTSCNQLLTQLDCYHDLTLIEADRMYSLIREGNLRAHINHAIDSLEQVFATHQIRTICLVDQRLPDLVDADFKRLHEILVILITNIAPYCHHSELVIQVRPSTLPLISLPEKRSNKATKMVQISLRDSGENLPNNIQTGLRKNPYSPSNTVIDQIHQMGMGFTFCLYLINALGGELHFSSSQGAGTEIWIDLPMGVGDEKKPEQKNSSSSPVIALWESDTLLDSPIITLLQQCNHLVKCYKESDIKQLLLDSTQLPFNRILITDVSITSEVQLELIEQLNKRGCQTIIAAATTQQFTDVKANQVYHYPITVEQLNKLLQSQG